MRQPTPRRLRLASVLAACALAACAPRAADRQPALAAARPRTPEIVAPGVLSDGNVYRGSFTPDGRELWFFERVGPEGSEEYGIFVSRVTPDGFATPERVVLGGIAASDLYPTISPDGERMVFSSYRRAPGDTSAKPNASLWSVDRVGDGWGEPVFIAAAAAPGHYHPHPQFAPGGALWFKRISPDWRTTRHLVIRPDGAGWTAPEEATAITRWRGWDPGRHVREGTPAPDGSFLILVVSDVDSATRRLGPPDLWVTFRGRDDSWSEPRPLAGGVNTEGVEAFPFFSPDGRVLYWVKDFGELRRIDVDAALGERPRR